MLQIVAFLFAVKPLRERERMQKGNANNCGKLSCDEQVFSRLFCLYHFIAFNTKPIDELRLNISMVLMVHKCESRLQSVYSAHAERN